MTTPLPSTPADAAPQTPPQLTVRTLTGATTMHRERGPLVVQQEPAARLARVLNNAAMELWDACTHDDPGSMWEEARAIASRILASCPL